MFKRLFFKYICKRLPIKSRRRIYLTSLLALITNRKSIEEPLLVKLNNLLKLAIEVRALELPIYLHSYFWDESIKNEVVTFPSGKTIPVSDIVTKHLDEEEIDFVASFLYSKSHKCLPYDEKEKVLSEIVLLLKSTHNVLKLNQNQTPPSALVS